MTCAPPAPPAPAPRCPPPPPPEALRRKPLPADAPAVSEVEARARAASLLVDAAKAGDTRAFGELVRRYRPRILALALHLTGNGAEAEDIAQDTFLKAYQHLPTFEGRSAFFTWVYRIALNRALQARAAHRQRPAVDLDDPRVALAVAIDAAGSPGRALELRETYAHLVCAFDQLSPTLRTTVALTTLQGLSHPEAAVVLGTTEGTIAWRMHEARNQLRGALDALHAAAALPRRVRKHSGPQRIDPRAPEAADPVSEALALALAMVFA